MRTKALTRWPVALLLIFCVVTPHPLLAQDDTTAKPFKTEELDQMLAPIALYPDDLLSNVLVASTYPLEVVHAARWRKESANAKLKGDGLTKALESKDWDPSVKSLTQTPDVLNTMSEKLDWTQKLGDAFLAQQENVMDRIQFLRQKAEDAGSLKTNEQQKVTKEEKYIVIEPAKPDVVYVPVYQPTVVYGTWWYPSYPPYYWYWGHPGSAFVRGFFWGAGYAVARNLWGWGRCDWRRGDININVNRYNKINVNRKKITSNKWKHDAKRRGAVPYRDKSTRNKFKKTARVKDARKEFRGFEDLKARDRVKDRARPTSADKVKKQLRDKGAPKVKDRARDKGRAKDRAKVAKRDFAKPSAKKKVTKRKTSAKKGARALNVKSGSKVKRNANRGKVSRKKAARHRGGGRKMGRGRGGGRRR